MSSDSDCDEFECQSSEEQIDRFEFRQHRKSERSKQKMKKPSCSISRKLLESQPALVREKCMSYKPTPPAERKPFRYNHYPEELPLFECDKQFQPTVTSIPQSHSLKQLDDEHRQSFSNFRRCFYRANHEQIKSSCKDYPHIELTDIRLVPIDESVQNDFMQELQSATHYPHLVFYGAVLNSLESIARHGLFLPSQTSPIDRRATVMSTTRDIGICYGQTLRYALCYTNANHILLVCAALPKRAKVGTTRPRFTDLLITSNLLRIIPLFVLDIQYHQRPIVHRPWFNAEKDIERNDTRERKTSQVISRKYLCRVLKAMNDDGRANNRYQVRSFSDSL